MMDPGTQAPKPPPPQRLQRHVAAEFAAEMRRLGKTERNIRRGTDWWESIRKGLRERGRRAKKTLGKWWEWPEMTRGGLWPGLSGYVACRLPPLVEDPEWKTRWRPALPDGILPDCPEHPGLHASSTAIGHAAHILHFERTSGTRMEDYDFIYEFGGGTGSFARIVHALGFRGRYVVHDLPELAAVQRMYLRLAGCPPVEHSSSLDVRPPPGARSLIVSLHGACEAGEEKAAAIASLMPFYDAALITAPSAARWQEAAGRYVIVSPVPGSAGSRYIVMPFQRKLSIFLYNIGKGRHWRPGRTRMRRFDTAYGIVRKSIIAACAGRKVEQWRAAVTIALQELKESGYLRSWQISSVNRRLKGIVIRIDPVNLPPAIVSILPEPGRSAVLHEGSE